MSVASTPPQTASTRTRQSFNAAAHPELASHPEWVSKCREILIVNSSYLFLRFY